MKSRGQIGVYIAEDSELLQEMLLASLSQIAEVKIVGQALGGKKAVEGVRQTHPDVLLLDLNMPGGDGFEVLKSLASDAERPVIIVMTFECHPMVQRQCLDLGADLFFDKGDDLDHLIELLQHLAAGECTLADLKQQVHGHPN